MANPITWRNVGGMDTSGVSSLMNIAQTGMNKGFEVAQDTLKNEIANRAADLKVSRDNTLNTALANLNKLNSEQFKDNNLVGSIAVNAGVSDPASMRAFEEQVNALRQDRFNEDALVAEEAHKANQRPWELKQAEANVKNTGSQTAQNYASANNLNASAASTAQQTSARQWEQDNRVALQEFEKNHGDLLGQLANADPASFNQDTYAQLTQGMNAADRRLFNDVWTSKRQSAIDLGGSQYTSQQSLLKGQDNLRKTQVALEGERVVRDLMSKNTPAGVESAISLMADPEQRVAALNAYNNLRGSTITGETTSKENARTVSTQSATEAGKTIASQATSPDDINRLVLEMYPNDPLNQSIARKSALDTYSANSAGKDEVSTAQVAETVKNLAESPETALTVASIANSSNPTAAIEDVVSGYTGTAKVEARKVYQAKLDEAANLNANKWVEANMDALIDEMSNPSIDPQKAYDTTLAKVPVAYRNKVKPLIASRLQELGGDMENVAKAITKQDAAISSTARMQTPQLVTLAKQQMDGTMTPKEVQDAVSAMGGGDPKLTEAVVSEYSKVFGKLNTLTSTQQNELIRESEALKVEYDQQQQDIDNSLTQLNSDYPYAADVAPTVSQAQLSDEAAKRIARVKATNGEWGVDYAPSRVLEKIDETMRSNSFRTDFAEQLNATLAPAIKNAVASGQITEAEGKALVNQLYSAGAQRAIKLQIIKQVVSADANKEIQFASRGLLVGGNIRQVEEAMPDAVSAVVHNTVNKMILDKGRDAATAKTKELVENRDNDFIKLQKRFTPNANKK